MEKLKIRYATALEAFKRFKEDIEILHKPQFGVYSEFHRQFRNSAIQSFEFSFDIFWKFIKDYVSNSYTVQFEAPTPRSVFRECTTIGFINEKEFNILSEITADRNLTSHMYMKDLQRTLQKGY
jgi:nucleotidyltransferase substrate binding protein (TIGR01987 family)